MADEPEVKAERHAARPAAEYSCGHCGISYQLDRLQEDLTKVKCPNCGKAPTTAPVVRTVVR